MASIALNARFFSYRSTETERYGTQMASRLHDLLKIVRPDGVLDGQLWEQMCLPAITAGRLLWSPSTTGPVAVAHQVCTVHDIMPIDHPEWFSSKVVRWHRWLMPRLMNRVQHIIAVSEFTKARLIERFGISPGKVSVVWNGVGSEFRPRSQREVQRIKAVAGINTPRYVVALGSSEPRVNLGRLLKAWEMIVPELPKEVELIVVGDKEQALLSAQIEDRMVPRQVNFVGSINQDHLPALYSGATAVVHPSLYEGFGFSPLEAMACGSAVVTSNSSSFPELVGNGAILVDPLDEESIADGVWRAIMKVSLRDEVSRRGFARVEPYTWDAAAEKTRAILLEQSQA